MHHQQAYLKRSICYAVFMACSLPTAQSFAQEFTLEEVIVTARKKEESVNDIPVAVTAMSGEVMESLQAFDPEDLAQYVPGFTARGTVYTIRGIGFNSGLSTSSGTVGVAYDQATLPYPAMSAGMVFDTERVEVLKGPQGSLYGRNTTGGQINYITNKPTDEFEASLMLEAGNYERTGFEGYISGPLHNNLLARLAVKHRETDKGIMRNFLNGERAGFEDKSAARLLLDFTPIDELQVMFSYNYWRDQSTGAGGQPIEYEGESACCGPLGAFSPDRQAVKMRK